MREYHYGMWIKRLLLPVLILPVNVLVIIPSLLLWLFGTSRWSGSISQPASVAFWPAVVMAAGGAALAFWTVWLFANRGRGTPAPWDPPQKLVIKGPYRHVRNPMITSVFLMLAGEAIFFHSWPLACWLLIFLVANLLYLPLSEEPRLAKRFGEPYRLYRANVPRWLPRIRPWRETF